MKEFHAGHKARGSEGTFVAPHAARQDPTAAATLPEAALSRTRADLDAERFRRRPLELLHHYINHFRFDGEGAAQQLHVPQFVLELLALHLKLLAEGNRSAFGGDLGRQRQTLATDQEAAKITWELLSLMDPEEGGHSYIGAVRILAERHAMSRENIATLLRRAKQSPKRG